MVEAQGQTSAGVQTSQHIVDEKLPFRPPPLILQLVIVEADFAGGNQVEVLQRRQRLKRTDFRADDPYAQGRRHFRENLALRMVRGGGRQVEASGIVSQSS